jgi:hypothetical protein
MSAVLKCEAGALTDDFADDFAKLVRMNREAFREDIKAYRTTPDPAIRVSLVQR